MTRRFLLILFLLVGGLRFGSLPVFASTDQHILIINQVRGRQCCDQGSLTSTQKQLEYVQKLQLPAAFALRYDAILDPDFHQLFQQASTSQPNQTPTELGIFLEITPQLAHDAGVSYPGPEDRWYKAKNAYLLGYQPEDRKKIIDTIFRAFHDQYGYYPTTTVGWMIDDISLRYLSEKYHVTVHELTREQWGTDSYTLYGGPVGTPYLPSKNWPLIPAATTANSLPIVMIRQTIMDPIYTYGDIRSVHTSQPNDYLQDGLDTKYFSKLLNASLQTSPKSDSVIGLENSMPQTAQDEFFKQLDSVPKAQVILPKNLSVNDAFNQQPNELTLSSRDETDQGKDLHAYWITTSKYRARVFINQKNVWLDDLRFYGDNLHDPYENVAPASLNAYWILPFWFDGSRYNSPQAAPQKQDLSAQIWTDITGATQKKPTAPQFTTIFNETESQPFGLELPERSTENAPSTESSPQQIAISYTASDHSPVKLLFHADTIEFAVAHPENLLPKFQVAASTQPELNSWQNALTSNNIASLNATISGQTLQITPTLNPNASISALIKQFTAELSPEDVQTPVDLAHSTIMYSNRSAIVGKNPIRIVVFLKDAQGKPIATTKTPQITAAENGSTPQKILFQQPETSQGEYFIDLFHSTAATFQLKLSVDGQTLTLKPISFVTDCKSAPLSCLRHPSQLWQFISTKVNDFFRKK